MAYVYPGAGAPEDAACRYGASRLLFRGPQRDVRGPYCVVLGGTETYGRYVARPFADLLEQALGVPVVNLGLPNAGLDAFVQDADVMHLVARARAVVVQVLGAQNLSNKFYAVHPRRNDRFLGGHACLKALFPEVDFTEFNFTRHLLQSLYRVSPDRFAVVAAELRLLWQERMRTLLAQAQRPVLLWAAPVAPLKDTGRLEDRLYPSLVTEGMMHKIRPLAMGCVEVRMEAEVHALLVDAAAIGTPGPTSHRMITRALMPILQQVV
jgi:Domain of unknown function (DUF6473)